MKKQIALGPKFLFAKLKAKDFSVLDEHEHPFSGSKLVLLSGTEKILHLSGRFKKAQVVGWASYSKKHFSFKSLYENIDKDRSEARFSQIIKNNAIPPISNKFSIDWQANKLYKWENKNLPNKKMNKKEITDLFNKISDDFGLSHADVNFAWDFEKYSGWSPDHGHFRMIHNDRASVIHEATHMVVDRLENENWAHHNPGFIRAYIEMLHIYHDLKIKKLEKSLEKKSIKFCALEHLPNFKEQINALG